MALKDVFECKGEEQEGMEERSVGTKVAPGCKDTPYMRVLGTEGSHESSKEKSSCCHGSIVVGGTEDRIFS